jgi:dihydrofolate reductase
MGKLVVNTFTTLDGVIQSPGMPEEDTEGGFDKGGWQVPYFDQESGQAMGEGMAAFDALLLGRKTYEIFAGFWPHAPADDPIAARLNEAPSTSLHAPLTRWDGTTRPCSRAI